MISPTVGVGAAVTRVSRTTPAAFATAIPHPFYFNRPRAAAGEITGLRREELGVHVQLRATFPIGSRVETSAFGGPSLFRIQQGIVTDFSYADSYPYDSVTFDAAQSSTVRKMTVGFNVGGDAAVFLTRSVGVGFTAMYSRAEGDLSVAEGRTVGVRAGGVTTGAGLRLRF
jgi:hypothetical protein